MDIKPIETHYNGYRFRSRLEARWAVFFDAAGIKYEYEPEGFACEDGTKYLPDFYLPAFNTYVEVKGEREGAWDEIKKAEKMIVWGGPIRRIIILSKVPEADAYDGGMWHFPCFYWDGQADCSLAGWWFFYDGYDYEPVHGHISHADYLPPWGILDNGDYWVGKDKELSFQCVSDTKLKEERFGRRKKISEFDDRMMCIDCNKRTFDAFKIAQQVRFEHGEAPTVQEE